MKRQKKALYNVEGKRETSMHQPDIDGERQSSLKLPLEGCFNKSVTPL
jgi:hypothetical protein